MKRILALIVIALVLPAQAADDYRFDTSHTNVLFFIDHLGFSEMVGRFSSYEGKISIDSEDYSNSRVEVSIDANSVSMFHDGLNTHLLNEDFFHVEAHPTLDFRSTSFEADADGNGALHGELTILGITKPVTLDVTLNKHAAHPMRPSVMVAGFSATGEIKRSDYGMGYALPAVGDTVRIKIDTELQRVDEDAED